jgi:serine protease AprX
MRRHMTVGLLLACVLLLVGLAPTGAAARTRPATPSDKDGNKIFDDLDRVIKDKSPGHHLEVVALFSEGSSEEEASDAARAVGHFRTIYEYEHLSGVVAEMTVGQIRSLAARSETLQIQHNSRLDFAMETARAAFGVDKALADFGHDGNNENSLICPGLKSYCRDDVVVAVLDTGIYWGHPDLNDGKVIANQDCASGDCMNLSGVDTNGHGTHVSSIIAGEGEANPAYRGVAPGAALVNVRIGSSYSTTVGALDAGIEWTIANRELYSIDVMNMSLNGNNPSDGTESSARLANLAAAAGILPVASAGNRGPNNGTTSYPGSAKFALQVGNMADPQDPVAGYPPGFTLNWLSGRGPTLDGRTKPDIVAPGTDITAAYITSNQYETLTGTSMSSPFAAGAAALLLDANPALASGGTACDATDTSAECADGVVDSTMNTRLKDTLTSTAVDFGPPGPDNDYGHGRLDVYAAVDAASPQVGTGGPVVPAHTFAQGTLAGSGATSNHTIEVTGTDAPIAVTLLWSRATGLTTPDFDLVLLGPSGNEVATEAMTNNWRTEVLDYIPTTTGTYTIRVRSAAGSGAYWLDASFPGAQIVPPSQPPATPAGLTATAQSASRIDLSWGDVAQESGYKIERSADGLTGWTGVGTTQADVTTFSNTGLTSTTTYHYRVIATNSVGDSAPSNVASATTHSAPAAPTNVVATAQSSTQINVSWSDVATETGYKVQRSATGTSGWSQIGTTTAGVTSFTNTGLSANTTYYYRVIAFNNAGDSPPSNVASAKTLADTVAPTTPTNLKAANGKLKITLTWNASTDAGGSGLAGYKIFRSTTSTGAYTQIATSTTTSYVDTAVSKGKTYWYYVQAYDGAGNNSAASAKVSGKPT